MLETCECTNIPSDVGLYTRKTENLATPLQNPKTLYLDGRSKLLKDTASILKSI
jgi:hypothetical protein